MNRRLFRWLLSILILTGILAAVAVFSLCVGSVRIPFREIISLFHQEGNNIEHSIVFGIRLPRILLGLAVGGALSIAGVILQGMFRNPLVEPYTLGISGGAALGVCLSILLRLTNTLGILTLPASGFLGAITVIFAVYLMSLKKGLLKIQGLLLTGVMISFICSSLIMLIMAVSRIEDLHGIIFWTMGSLETPQWFLIKIALAISLSGLIISYLFSIDLNAFSLGEEEALHLGVNTERSKRLLFILASLLTGCSVSVAGIIGFVGLIVPHLMRMLVGADHRILLIASYLSGAAFLILCDTLARTIIAPMELPVGVVTGIIGGTLFVYALTKRQLIPLGDK